MSRPANAAALAEGAIRQAAASSADARATALDRAGEVFRVLHGMYGVTFTSKWASGVTTADGGDAGLESARAIWAHGLRAVSEAAVKDALRDCLALYPEFAPSLPQFVTLCRARETRQAFVPERSIGMSAELRSAQARAARERLAAHRAQLIDRRTGYRELPDTLHGLLQAVADAVGCAGGDEAATLAALERAVLGGGGR